MQNIEKVTQRGDKLEDLGERAGVWGWRGGVVECVGTCVCCVSGGMQGVMHTVRVSKFGNVRPIAVCS